MVENAVSTLEGERPMLDPATWVDAHGDILFRFALARVRDHDVAEELVQETFVAALASRDKYSGAASERTWMIGILKFKMIDHFRRCEHDSVSHADLAQDSALDSLYRSGGHWKQGPAKWEVDAPALLERAEFWAIFDDCVRGLPDRVAQAFMLRAVDGQEADSVCKALRITPTNLWALLHRARGRLRKCLENKWFGEHRKAT